MQEADGAWIRVASDLESNAQYASFEEFVIDLNNQTDMDVLVELSTEGVMVEHAELRCSAAGQNFFAFPFDTDDVLSWVYHFENDNSIRHEVHGDVLNMLDVPVYEDEVEDEAEALRDERTERVMEFVECLLWERWIDLDGSDLLLMDPTTCEPLEMTASHEWVTPTDGAVSRPFRPARHQPTVAKLYSDGRLALSWPGNVDVVEEDGLVRALPDLLIIDLAKCDMDEAIEFYDAAYEAMYADLQETVAPATDGRDEDSTVQPVDEGEDDVADSTHVVVGRSANGADARIRALAEAGGECGWTVPRVARTGDRVLFYLLNPEGSFIATGRLLSDATSGHSKEGKGKYVANIGDVRALRAPVPRMTVVEHVPDWGWPRQPHTATTVPTEQVGVLLNLLS